MLCAAGAAFVTFLRCGARAGLVVLPGALTPDEQRRIAADAFTAWPDAPNRTNHSAHLGPLRGLWAAAQAVWASSVWV